MLTLIFDRTATEFGSEYYPEKPARLINTESYLLDKRPEWVWISPRLATEQEVLRVHHPKHLERLRLPVDFDSDTPYYPDIEDHARRADNRAYPNQNRPATEAAPGVSGDAPAKLPVPSQVEGLSRPTPGVYPEDRTPC